jgi:triosephosphate isomerase
MRPLIAGNWKMQGMAPQLGEIEAVAAWVQATPPFADVLICLPATLMTCAVRTAAGRIGIGIGGEDCNPKIAGAFTGDLSAEMLTGAGAGAVIVGHSERRQHQGETNALVATKVLYSGSVKPGNARTILALAEVGGVLVGGSSLKTADFNAIIRSVPVTAWLRVASFRPIVSRTIPRYTEQP